MLFYDRITGQKQRDPIGSIVPGRCFIDFDEPYFINSAVGVLGGFLIPDTDGQWLVRSITGEELARGQFRLTVLPTEREQKSLLAIGGILAQLQHASATWSRWKEISPLTMNLDEKARLQALEGAVEDDLWHIEEVCRRPQIYIRQDTERVLISRARRVPLGAIAYLASHTEDWQNRTFHGIVPKRILALVTEDQLNLYENRVTVRLVDHLRTTISQRLEELDKIESQLGEVLESGTKWRQDRVYQMLGDALMDENLRDQVQSTKRTLTGLFKRLTILRGSLLYKALARQNNVAKSIRMTNIFVNDSHYRYVARLWQIWAHNYSRTPPTPQEKYTSAQDLGHHFDYFCMLLVIRAFHQLGYSPIGLEERAILPGSTFALQNQHSPSLELAWEPDRTMSIRVTPVDGMKGWIEKLTFIPLVGALTSPRNTEEVHGVIEAINEEIVASLNSSKSDSSSEKRQVVVLYSGESGERDQLPQSTHLHAQTLGNDLFQPRPVGFIPVRTDEVESVERVARSIRWAVLAGQFMTFPPMVPMTEFAQKLFLEQAKWLHTWDHHRVMAVDPPDDKQQTILYDAFERERRRLKSQGRSAVRRIRLLDESEEGVRRAIAMLDRLLRCPICNLENPRRQFRVRLNGPITKPGFWCQCVECESSWGIAKCGSCGERFPFLSVSYASSVPADTNSAGWTDRILGMDVLSVPCWLLSANDKFICPFCGQCPETHKPIASQCKRCHQV